MTEASQFAGPVPFVGRERELAVLRRKLDEAIAGMGSVALISGEPGVGKTRLAEQLSTLARERGMIVLWGHCYEGEGAPPFWPWVQVVRTYARQRDVQTLQKQMGPGAADIAQVVPEVGEHLPNLVPPPPLESAQARFRFFDSISGFLTRAGGDQPLLLVVDDLHWADGPSLQLLQFLAHELPPARLLVAGTYRDTDVRREHPLTAALAELSRWERTDRLVLSGLAETDVARFIQLSGGDSFPSSLVEAIARETEGNPFFVLQMLRLIASEGWLERERSLTPWNLALPPSVREVLGRRLDHLSPACHSVLTIAAVLGREFRLAALEHVSELSGDVLLEAIEEACRARILQPVRGSTGGYAFTHALMRETLYEELGPAARVRLHRQAGDALEGLYGADPGPHLAELAYHFSQAALGGSRKRAVAYARRAGDRALSLLAYEDAAAHYQRALDIAAIDEPSDERERCELLLSLSDAWSRAGETPTAWKRCLEAARLARKLADSELLARAALGFGAARPRTGVVDSARVELLHEALESVGPGETALRARLLGRLARELYWSDAHGQRELLSREGLALARRLGESITLARALLSRHWSIWWPETLDERLQLAGELIPLAERLGEKEFLLEALHCSIADLIELGDMPAVRLQFDRYAQLAAELRQPLYLWYVALRRTMLANLEGRFDEALELDHAAYALGQRVQGQDARELFVGLQGHAMEARGRLAEHIERFKASNMPAAPLHTRRVMLTGMYCRLGNLDAARTEFEAMAGRDFADLAYNAVRLTALGQLADVCAALGDTRRAAILYDMLLPFGGRQLVNGGLAQTYFGPAARSLALLAATLGRWREAAGHFETAIERGERMGARPWVARSQEEYGRMLVERGRREDLDLAHSLFGQALQTYREIGLQPGIERAKVLLTRAQPPRPSRVVFPDGLSVREVEILRLVAAGRSNREIAETLVISLSTVAYHLSNILGKTGAANRTEAAAYAHRRGLA